MTIRELTDALTRLTAQDPYRLDMEVVRGGKAGSRIKEGDLMIAKHPVTGLVTLFL